MLRAEFPRFPIPRFKDSPSQVEVTNNIGLHMSDLVAILLLLTHTFLLRG
jgi:hypothetical protein